MILSSPLYTYSCIVVSLLLISTCVHNSSAEVAWADCGEPLNSQAPRFTLFDLFQTPVVVGEIVHVRAVVTLPAIATGSIAGGTITMSVSAKGITSFSIPGISLCNSTPAIACSAFGPGDNAVSFDFEVPKIPAGEYEIKLSFTPDLAQVRTGCLRFTVKVIDPTQPSTTYTSWIKATLVGVAQFAKSSYDRRAVGEPVQVGPIGPAEASVAINYQWGTFASVAGSQDLVTSDFVPSGYVWGLSGTMVHATSSISRNWYQHTYAGSFYIGYVSDLAQHALDTFIASGQFFLTWTYVSDGSGDISSNLVGNFSFDDKAVLPTGWGAPISLGRLGAYSLYTTNEGLLMVNASSKYCLTSTPCNYAEYNAVPNGKQLSRDEIVIIVVLVVGVPLIATLIIMGVFYWRHKRNHDQESEIFSAARKPEYGNALVIDDIIQESRDHAEGEQQGQDSGESSYYSGSEEDGDDDEFSPRDKGGRDNRSGKRRTGSDPSSDSQDLSDRSPLSPVHRPRGRHSRSRSRSRSLSSTPRSRSQSHSRSRSHSNSPPAVRSPPRTDIKGKGKRPESDYSDSLDASYLAQQGRSDEDRSDDSRDHD